MFNTDKIHQFQIIQHSIKEIDILIVIDENLRHVGPKVDEIFKEIKWEFDSDPKYGHLERASVHFGLIIRGISYGVYNLKLTHNSRTDSRSYKQNNAMTQIHWGPIREFISRRNLMGCVLKLYQPIERTDIFIIEIE